MPRQFDLRMVSIDYAVYNRHGQKVGNVRWTNSGLAWSAHRKGKTLDTGLTRDDAAQLVIDASRT